jgi:hypothetical protein
MRLGPVKLTISKLDNKELSSQKFTTRDLVATPFSISPSMLSTG